MNKLVATLVCLLALSACTGASNTSPESTKEGSAAAASSASGNPAVDAIAAGNHVVIDVRTPEEFSTGHVKGARNIDVTAADFSEQVKTLDLQGKYVVYCRSGNRSATAKRLMEQAGFTTVLDGGGFEDLKAAGAPTE